MPTPSPEPTADEIETLVDITMLSTDEVVEMVASPATQAVADAKWSKTRTDITSWNNGIASEAGDVKRVGNIEFFENKAIDYRLDFRNRIRTRYGKDLLASETSLGWCELVTTLKYF